MSLNKNMNVRTVRDGKVKIRGVYYTPRDPGYDGRFEGRRFAFGSYWTGRELYRGLDGETFVCLWGTERDYQSCANFRGDGSDEPPMPDWGKPPVCVNGVFEFEWWNEAPRG